MIISRNKQIKFPGERMDSSHHYTGLGVGLQKASSMSTSCHSLPPYLDRPCSAASTCSNQSEEEMIAIIDQLTNHMFDADQGEQKEECSDRRANSLPRNPRFKHTKIMID